MRKIIQLALLLSLCSCGFRIIYEERTDVVSYAQELAAIRIKKDRTRLSQQLKNNLYDILNPDYLKVEPKYFLILDVKELTSSTFTTITGASGRNKVTLTASYEFRNLETGETISTGTTSVSDNYDVTANRYGTYVADEYIQSNITIIAAQNIRNSLVNDLIETKKKCDGEIELNNEKNDAPEFVCPLANLKKDISTKKIKSTKKPFKKH
jgi:hypothetical protein